MIDIKKTKLYNHVKNNNSDSVTALPFYVDSGIEVTESNIKYIVETELIEYEKKIEQVKQFKQDFPLTIQEIEEKLTNQLKERIGKNKLDMIYAYVNSENIDHAISEIEKAPEFVDWCVE